MCLQCRQYLVRKVAKLGHFSGRAPWHVFGLARDVIQGHIAKILARPFGGAHIFRPHVIRCGRGSVGARPDDESAMLLRRASIDVAAAVEVIVDFGGSADHAAVEKHVEGSGLQVPLAERAGCGLSRVFFTPRPPLRSGSLRRDDRPQAWRQARTQRQTSSTGRGQPCRR